MKISSIKEPKYKHQIFIDNSDKKKYYRQTKNFNLTVNDVNDTDKIHLKRFKKLKKLFILQKLQNQLKLNNCEIKQSDFYFDIKDWVQNSKITLIFSNNFNQQVNIPNGITNLIFGWEFNQEVTIPNSAIHLAFSYNFNQKINIPSNVTYLKFGYFFNQPVEIPNSLTNLTFGFNFNKIVTSIISWFRNLIPNRFYCLVY